MLTRTAGCRNSCLPQPVAHIRAMMNGGLGHVAGRYVIPPL